MTRFAKKNTHWIGLLDAYLLSHLDILDALPEDVHFVLIPEDDPELAYYNVQTAIRNIEGWQTPVAVSIQTSQDMPSFHFNVVEDLSVLLFDTTLPA